MPSELQKEDTSVGMPEDGGMGQQDTPVPRMRTMQECVDYLASKDPETKVKYCTLRRWTLEGKIPFVQIGNRKLINLDLLIDIVNGKRHWEQKKNLKVLPRGGR